MALLPVPNVDYTDKDFDSLRARLLELVRSVYPSWRDDDVADFGNLLLECFAYVGDVVAYYQDNQAREAFLPTVTQYRNALALVRLLNYQPRGNTVSTVDVTFTLATPAVQRVVLPARTRVLTDSVVEPVVYETVAGVAWEVGQSGARVVGAENAEAREELFTADGTPEQVLVLAGVPYVDDSLTLAASGDGYTEVDSLIDSGPTDRHYTVDADEEGRATVRFGDGVLGAVPSGTVTAAYRIGGGSAGRVEAGKLKRLEAPVLDEGGNPVQVSVTNAEASSLGEDRQSVDSIRELAPRSLRAQERTVALEDYESNALNVAGVGRALMLTSDQADGIEENAGILFLVASGGAAPSQALLDAVLAVLTTGKPRTVTFHLSVQSALFLDVAVRVEVALVPGASGASVKAAIQAALEAYFDADEGSVDFGYRMRDASGNASLAWSDVFNAVRDSAGVRRVPPDGVRLNGVVSDLAVDPQAFPRLGVLTVIDVATGDPL